MKRSYLFVVMLVFIVLRLGTSDYKPVEINSEDYVIDMYDNITGTVYHAVMNQTDDTPLITADLSKIDTSNIENLRWVALSRDLIYNRDIWGRNWDGKIKFGDSIYIDSEHPEINGWWVVHDVMNKRYKNRIDFLQPINGTYGKWENITIKAQP